MSSIYLTLYSTSYLALVTPKKQNIHFPPRFLWVSTKCSLSSGSHFDKTMEMQSTKESKPGFLSILSGEWIDVPETDRVSRSKFETAFMLLFLTKREKSERMYIFKNVFTICMVNFTAWKMSKCFWIWEVEQSWRGYLWNCVYVFYLDSHCINSYLVKKCRWQH